MSTLSPAPVAETSTNRSIKSQSDKLRGHWEPYLSRFSDNPDELYFTAKVSFWGTVQLPGNPSSEQKAQVTHFFPRELQRGDVFVEFIDFQYALVHNNPRRLFRLPFREDYRTAYAEKESSTGTVYVVPIALLEAIDLPAQPASAAPAAAPVRATPPRATPPPDPREKSLLEILPTEPVEGDDAHLNLMTMRDRYCMTQNVPLSNKGWLNELIVAGLEFKRVFNLNP
jgi:hypothetical protein